MQKLTGTEEIKHTQGLTVADFWKWAYSDVLSNRNRSIFAEFLVASVLSETDKPRIEWDAVDIRYNNKKIEVKSAAYVQSWYQNKLSDIRYAIEKRFAWDSETNVYNSIKARNADCYIFCLFEEKVSEDADVFDTGKWKFFVVKTQQLEENFFDQKTVSLGRLKRICLEVDFENLKQAVEKALC